MRVGLTQGWIAASLGGFAARGTEVAAKLALYMLAARKLGDQECGVLFLCLTWITLAGSFARLGTEKALSRLIAAEIAMDQGKAARRVLVQGAMLTLASSVVVALATSLLAAPVAALLFHSEAARPALLATALAIPCLSMAVTIGYALVGFGRSVLSQVLLNLFWPVGLLVGLLAGLEQASSLMLLMAATQIAAALAAVIAIAGNRSDLVTDATLPQDFERLPSLWHTAMPLYVVELVQVSIQSLPVLILGVFTDPATVGVFSIALRASMLVLVVLLSLGMVAAPRFAALHRQGDWRQLAVVGRRTQWAGLICGGAICLVLALGARPLLSLIGQRFADGMPALLVLLGGQLINALYAGQDSLLAMTGQGPALRALNLLQLAMMLALSLALIPSFGEMGAAVVTAWVTAQGALGAAMAVASFYPQAAPRLLPPMSDGMRRFFLRWTA